MDILGQATDITKSCMPMFNCATLSATSIDSIVPILSSNNEAYCFTDTTGRAVDALAYGRRMIDYEKDDI